MRNIKAIKKKVTEDWQEAFPSLVKYGQNKYYKILGPLLVGIELIKPASIEKYSPHFVVYPLWGNRVGKDLKASLSIPIIIKPFFDKKEQEFFIPYFRHEAEFTEVLEAVKNQLPFSMDGDVNLKEVFLTFEEMSKTPPLSAAYNSYLQASLLESKLELAICSGGRKEIVEGIYDEIKAINWDLDHFALWGIEYEIWIKNMESRIADKNQLLSQLSANKQDKKLTKMHSSELRP